MAMTNEQLTKWIDEIFGTIDEIKTNSGDITGLTRTVKQLREDLTATQEDVTALETDTAGTVSLNKAQLQHFTDGSTTQALDLVADIIPVQAGTGNPSPTNVRAITGYSSVTATAAGKNIFGGLAFAQKLNSIADSSNIDTSAKTVTFNRCTDIGNTLLYNNYRSGVGYTLFVTGNITSSGNNNSLTFAGNYINFDSTTKSTKRIYVAPDAADKNFILSWRDTASTTLYYEECGLFEGDVTIEDFEAYTANTATISLGTTVYSGTVNFTTGALTIDKAMVDLGDLTWTKEATSTPDVYRFHAGDLSPVAVASQTTINGVSDIFKCTSVNSAWSGSENNIIGVADAAVYVRCDTYSEGTAAEFKTAMDGKQLLYELATPITTTLTPAQLSLLQGENNVSATSGPITLTYAPDNVLAEVYAYIQKRFDTLTASLAANRTTRKTTKTLTKKED